MDNAALSNYFLGHLSACFRKQSPVAQALTHAQKLKLKIRL